MNTTPPRNDLIDNSFYRRSGVGCGTVGANDLTVCDSVLADPLGWVADSNAQNRQIVGRCFLIQEWSYVWYRHQALYFGCRGRRGWRARSRNASRLSVGAAPCARAAGFYAAKSSTVMNAQFRFPQAVTRLELPILIPISAPISAISTATTTSNPSILSDCKK